MLMTGTASVFVDMSTTCPTSQDQNLVKSYTYALGFFGNSLILSQI